MSFAREATMMNARFSRSLAITIFSAMLVASCSKSNLDTPPKGGAGGATAGTGGASGGVPGVGGATLGLGGNGGSTPGTGGATSGPDAAPQGCVEGGHTYAVGETFKSDCNTCTCTERGASCTLMACIVSNDASTDRLFNPDASDPCSLSANLTFGEDGGNALYWDTNSLTTSTFTITRSYSWRANPDGATTSACAPSLPACGAAGVVTVATINVDLADPEVAELWTLPQDPVPLFGEDARPVDGTVYSIALDDGRKVLVGTQCASPVMSSCRSIPEGLVRLTEDLRTLSRAMLADPACVGL